MAVRTAGHRWRWLGRVRAGGLVLALAAAALPWGVAVAQASVNPAALRLTVTKVVAGTTGYTLGWTYQAPLRQKVTGTISLDVPAGFTAPQAGPAGTPGYVSTISACARFSVTGTAPQPDGSTLISIAVRCAAQQTGTISYTGVAVPTAAGRYGFPAAFTPAGSAAVPFAQADTVTVVAGAVASLVITPGSVQLAPGASQAYTAEGFDAYGNPRDVTAGTQFAITPDGSCTANVCTAASFGPHTVTATRKHLTATAALLIAQADLAVTQTVNNTAPFYYAPVTFTTTITNTGATSTADEVTAAVTVPAGLISPNATASTGSYDASTSTWTIGSLAPGATATLTVTADAADPADGAQTLTATVTSTTPDPNPANNTASASETSQPPPIAAFITPDPGNSDPVDVCTPGTVTWDASVGNAANPDAPPSSAGNVIYAWSCSSPSGPCPRPANNPSNATYITYNNGDLNPDTTYTLTLTVTPDQMSKARVPVQTTAAFGTECVGP